MHHGYMYSCTCDDLCTPTSESHCDGHTCIGGARYAGAGGRRGARAHARA
eukprot:COSAG02_NODE_41330_length_395_cov_5.219595_1_plen_49_part_10